MADDVSNRSTTNASSSSTLTPTARSSRSHVTQRSTIKKKKKNQPTKMSDSQSTQSKNNNNHDEDAETIDSDSDDSIGKGLGSEGDELAALKADHAKRRESSLLLSQRLDSSSSSSLEEEEPSVGLSFNPRRASGGSASKQPTSKVAKEKSPPVASLVAATNRRHSESVTSQPLSSLSPRRNNNKNDRYQSIPNAGLKTTGLCHSSSSESSAESERASRRRRSHGSARSRTSTGAGWKTTGLVSIPSNGNNNTGTRCDQSHSELPATHRNTHTAAVPRAAAAAAHGSPSRRLPNAPSPPPPGTQEAPIEFSDDEEEEVKVRYSITRVPGIDKDVLVLEDSDSDAPVNSDRMVVEEPPLRSCAPQPPSHRSTSTAAPPAQGRGTEPEREEKDEMALSGEDPASQSQHDNDNSSSLSLPSTNSSQPNRTSGPQSTDMSKAFADGENPLNSTEAVAQKDSSTNVFDASEEATNNKSSTGEAVMDANFFNSNNNNNNNNRNEMSSTRMAPTAEPVTQDFSDSPSASHRESTKNSPQNSGDSKKKKTKQASHKAPPPLPTGWVRCHAYLQNKHRYCRQLPSTNSKYCGNHQELDEDHHDDGDGTQETGTTTATASVGSCDVTSTDKSHRKKRKTGYSKGGKDTSKRKRIPCPLDQSHSIYEDMVERHLKICPKATQQQQQEQQPYYQKNVNGGGHGSMKGTKIQQKYTHLTDGNENTPRDTLARAKNFALCVLFVHQKLFQPETITKSAKSNVEESLCNLTLNDIESALPFQDLSSGELDAGLAESMESYHIRSGGPKHLRQQASLLGHLRRISSRKKADDIQSIKASDNGISEAIDQDTLLLELGAGRGMLGLVTAGSFASSSNSSLSNKNNNVDLIMIERAGTRSKADTILRNHKSELEGRSLNIEQVRFWQRIQCDLAHVHMPTVVTAHGAKQPSATASNSSFTAHLQADKNNSNSNKIKAAETKKPIIMAIAKHLCGAGTDLALKALYPIRDQIHVCMMATCCHGVCSWEHYVGRDYLGSVLTEDPKHGVSSPTLSEFGPDEFEMLRLWSSGTVSDVLVSGKAPILGNATRKHQDEEEETHQGPDPNSGGKAMGVSTVAASLQLKCGVQGLGRACQRLLDYGRKEYLRKVLFAKNQDEKAGNNGALVELCYYVKPAVTPQNAVLIASRMSTLAAAPVTRDTSNVLSASHLESKDATCTEHVTEDNVSTTPTIIQRFESGPLDSRRLKQEDGPGPSTETGQTKKVPKAREKKYKRNAKDLGNIIQVERLNTSFMARLVLVNEQEVVVNGKDGETRVRVQWQDRRTREDVLQEELQRDTEIEVPRPRKPDDAGASAPPSPPTGRPRRTARRRIKTDFYSGTYNVKKEDTEEDESNKNVKEEENSMGIDIDANNCAGEDNSADGNPAGKKKQRKKTAKRKPKGTRASVNKRRGIKADPDTDEVPVHSDPVAIKADPDEEALSVNGPAGDDIVVDLLAATLQPLSPPRRTYPSIRYRPRPPSETGRKPRIWSSKTKIKVPPRRTEIGDVVYFVEPRDSYSCNLSMTSEELLQQPSARVIGDSCFYRTKFFYNQPERLLQLQCDKTLKRWYVPESSIQNPHF